MIHIRTIHVRTTLPPSVADVVVDDRAPLAVARIGGRTRGHTFAQTVLRAGAVMTVAGTMTGCQPRTTTVTDDVSASFWTRMEQESDRLLALLDVGTLVSLVAVVAALVFGGRFLDRLAHSLARDESPFAKIVDDARPTIKTVALVMTSIVLLRGFIIETPIIGALSLGLLAAGTFFTIGSALPSWISGMSLVVRREIREGDRLVLSDREGVIAHLGLVRTRVRFDDGTESNLPVSIFGRGEASVASPRSAVSVEGKYSVGRSVNLDDVDALETVLRLCPYRDTSHPLRVRIDPDDDKRMVVALHAWGEKAAPFARGFVTRAIRDFIERAPSS